MKRLEAPMVHLRAKVDVLIGKGACVIGVPAQGVIPVLKTTVVLLLMAIIILSGAGFAAPSNEFSQNDEVVRGFMFNK